MLRNFSKHTLVQELDCVKLKSILNITSEQLIDLAVILGTDYNDGISGISPIAAYKLFSSVNYDMLDFIDQLKIGTYKSTYKLVIPDDFLEKWQIVKNYYLTAEIIDPTKVNMTWNEPKYDELYRYLVETKQINSVFVQNKIDEIRLLYKYYKLNNDRLMTMTKIKLYSKSFQIHSERNSL
jgi:flap endonuclease-1